MLSHCLQLLSSLIMNTDSKESHSKVRKLTQLHLHPKLNYKTGKSDKDASESSRDDDGKTGGTHM